MSEYVFPQPGSTSHLKPFAASEFIRGGLTKRELFAAMAMQGFLAWSQPEESGLDLGPEGCAGSSIRYADALIARLAEKKK